MAKNRFVQSLYPHLDGILIIASQMAIVSFHTRQMLPLQIPLVMPNQTLCKTQFDAHVGKCHFI